MRFLHGRPWALVAAALLLGPSEGVGQSEPSAGGTALTRFPWAARPSGDGVHLLDLTVWTALRSSWTDDRDNGSLWAGRGVSGLVRGGVALRRGPLLVVLAPEVTASSNGSFPVADVIRAGYSRYSAPWLPVDLPRRWGNRPVWQLHPGQSSVELRWRALALGASSANMIRGPELRYPIMLGNSAPGVPQAFLEGHGSLGAAGRFAARAQWGVLQESPYFDENDRNDHTLLSGFFVDWLPGFAPGLTLGASLTYRDPLTDGFTPSMLFRAFSTMSAQDEAQKEEDALGAVHALWDTGRLAVWGTWARGDYWLSLEDLLTEPDHNQLYALGARWGWSGGTARWVAAGEAASLTGTLRRQTPIPYRHHLSVQGYTHLGQILGASIGPGSRGAWLMLQRMDSARTIGVEVERIDRDRDAYHLVLLRPDGSAGQDREWRLAALYGGGAQGPGSAALKLRGSAGLSLRWNRDYVRYSGNAALVGARESNWFLDLAVAWVPDARRR